MSDTNKDLSAQNIMDSFGQFDWPVVSSRYMELSNEQNFEEMLVLFSMPISSFGVVELREKIYDFSTATHTFQDALVWMLQHLPGNQVNMNEHPLDFTPYVEQYEVKQ
tara:strand:+ start:36615 stop:36938 length:324 start_codon:yes stop_codon:yes gene_type:complete